MMTTPPDFDSVMYKESTRQQWERVAAAVSSASAFFSLA
jgi:hypothetical protein